MRGGPPQPRVPLVLPAGSGRRGPGPLDLLQEPPRTLPRRDLLRHVFEARCAGACAKGLVGGEGFAVDASLIEADANEQRSTAREDWDPAAIDPDTAPRAVRRVAVLDDAAFGAASPVEPKFTSPADPAAQWTGAQKGHAFFAYATNYLVDTDNAIIVDVETTAPSARPRSAPRAP